MFITKSNAVFIFNVHMKIKKVDQTENISHLGSASCNIMSDSFLTTRSQIGVDMSVFVLSFNHQSMQYSTVQNVNYNTS